MAGSVRSGGPPLPNPTLLRTLDGILVSNGVAPEAAQGARHDHAARSPCRRTDPPRGPHRLPPFSPPAGTVEYLLSDEAIGAGSVTVEEVSEGGSVPNLLVSNTGDSRVLFLEGEELKGAKQNRVLNTSVLVAAHSKTPIPVSCVEQGRWRYRTQALLLGRVAFVLQARRHLKESVARSLKAGQRAHVGPGGRLGGGRPPDGRPRLHVGDGGDGGHLRAAPGPPERVPGAVAVRRGCQRGRRRRGAEGRRRGRVRQALDLPEGLGPAC